MNETLDSLFTIRYLPTNELQTWTLGQILHRINEDNYSSEYDYDITDWREGFNETLEGKFYSLLDTSGEELNLVVSII